MKAFVGQMIIWKLKDFFVIDFIFILCYILLLAVEGEVKSGEILLTLMFVSAVVFAVESICLFSEFFFLLLLRILRNRWRFSSMSNMVIFILIIQNLDLLMYLYSWLYLMPFLPIVLIYKVIVMIYRYKKYNDLCELLNIT